MSHHSTGRGMRACTTRRFGEAVLGLPTKRLKISGARISMASDLHSGGILGAGSLGADSLRSRLERASGWRR
jgi:hypothetical protein